MAHEQQPGRRSPHDLVRHDSYTDPQTGYRHDSTSLPLPPEAVPEVRAAPSGKWRAFALAVVVLAVATAFAIWLLCR